MGTLKTTNIESISGSGTVTLGTSGETFTVPSGVTVNMSSATQTGVGGDNTPAFEAFLSSDTSQLSNDTDTKITFDTEIYDSDGTYDTSNGRFTPAVAAKYFIYGRLEFEDSNVSATDEHMVKIFKNGSQASVFFTQDSAKHGLISYHEVFDLGSSDYIEIYAKINNSDGARIINGLPVNQKASTFGAYKLIT